MVVLNNPINDELAYQMELVLETVAKKVEWSAFNASYNDGTSGNRQMRGLDQHCSLSGGNIIHHDTDGDGTNDREDVSPLDALIADRDDFIERLDAFLARLDAGQDSTDDEDADDDGGDGDDGAGDDEPDPP